jgi:2-oxoglutarate ferredoxin oxidoreductase subunit alpha
VDRLNRKYDTARKQVPRPVIDYAEDSRVGILAFGTTDVAIGESRVQLEREIGLTTHYLRLRAIPFTSDLGEFFERCDRVYVVEQNRDAQMAILIKLDLPIEQAAKIRNILHYDGIPIDARFVTDQLIEAERGEGN